MSALAHVDSRGSSVSVGLLSTRATALMVFVWVACTAWMRPLLLPDEGRYVGVAWEMLRSGDWLTPTLNGLPYFHKPPLFYWITAASLSVFGQNEWAARMASMLGATLAVMALFLFVRHWLGERRARYTLVVLLAQPLLMIGGQFANLDMLVAGCITATIVLLAHSVFCAERRLPHRAALTAAYGMAALGVLAKGLIGFVIPALVIFAWLLLRKRSKALLSLIWWPGILLFLLLAGPWFVATQWHFPGFFDYFVVVQHFKRFAAGGFNNVMPLWFYPFVLTMFSLPWLPWIARVLNRRYLSDLEQQPLRLLMLVWVGTVVFFFSLPQSKLLGYVLPAVPPLCFLIADGFLLHTGASKGTPSKRRWVLANATAVAFSIAAVGWFALYARHSMRDFASTMKDQRQAGEPVVMLGSYYFDLPFYARLEQPVGVVYTWDDPAIHRFDSPRKELLDAGEFAPATAGRNLVRPGALPSRLCQENTSWVIGPTSAIERFPYLKFAIATHEDNGTTLWRVDKRQPVMFSALQCASLAQVP